MNEQQFLQEEEQNRSSQAREGQMTNDFEFKDRMDPEFEELPAAYGQCFMEYQNNPYCPTLLESYDAQGDLGKVRWACRGDTAALEFIETNKALWAEEEPKRPIMSSRRGHLRSGKWVEAHFVVTGFEEPEEQFIGPTWVMLEAQLRVWPRVGAAPRRSLGLEILAAMVRMKQVTSPGAFFRLLEEVTDLDSRLKAKAWAWFELVTFKRNRQAYVAWKQRQRLRAVASKKESVPAE